MGLFSFAKSAGQKLFRRGGESQEAQAEASPAAEAAPEPAPAETTSVETAPVVASSPPPEMADLIAQSILVARQATAAEPVAAPPAVDTSSHGTVIGSGAERVYITKDGQSVDELAAYFYGDAAHAVRIRDENPVLAGFSGALPGGLRLVISEDLPQAPVAETFAGDSQAEAEVAARLAEVVGGLGLSVEDLGIQVSGDTATVTGTAATQADREKVVLVLGNTAGIAAVDDQMTVQEAAPESVFYTVQPGDTLSAIAAAYYGDPNKYGAIFDANRPMLESPDLIYPGQALRIPPQ